MLTSFLIGKMEIIQHISLFFVLWHKRTCVGVFGNPAYRLADRSRREREPPLLLSLCVTPALSGRAWPHSQSAQTRARTDTLDVHNASALTLSSILNYSNGQRVCKGEEITKKCATIPCLVDTSSEQLANWFCNPTTWLPHHTSSVRVRACLVSHSGRTCRLLDVILIHLSLSLLVPRLFTPMLKSLTRPFNIFVFQRFSCHLFHHWRKYVSQVKLLRLLGA